jgi:glycosyl transferase family 25
VLQTNSSCQLSDTNKVTDGVGVYLINMDRAKERYDNAMKSIPKLNLPTHRISAVDGLALSKTELDTVVDFEAYRQFMGHYPNLGTIGCSLSHLKTWKEFLKSDYEFALIFEDDMGFDGQLLAKVIKELTTNAKLWDIVSFDILHRGLPLTIKKLNNIDEKLSVYLGHILRSGGYLINRNTACKLLEKALPIKMPIDYYFTRSWEFGIKFTGIEPRIVQKTYEGSTIRPTPQSRSVEEPEPLGQRLYRALYKVQWHVMKFGYNLMIYIKSK